MWKLIQTYRLKVVEYEESPSENSWMMEYLGVGGLYKFIFQVKVFID